MIKIEINFMIFSKNYHLSIQKEQEMQRQGLKKMSKRKKDLFRGRAQSKVLNFQEKIQLNKLLLMLEEDKRCSKRELKMEIKLIMLWIFKKKWKIYMIKNTNLIQVMIVA